jgi:hypothetical protein
MAQTPENKSADEKVASLIADIQKALEELKKAQGADEACRRTTGTSKQRITRSS